MKYDVSVWKSDTSPSPEIWAWDDTTDPIDAALSVLARFGLRAAFYVRVGTAPGVTVAEFVNVNLPDTSSLSSSESALSYDYSV